MLRPVLKRLDRAALALAIGWASLYVWRALVRHYSLDTNAYDLSVYDYAIWGITRGDLGWVPFMGHSIFSHHFMPILFVLVPIYAVFQSPTWLLVLQIVGVAGAGLLFYEFQRRIGLPRALSLALLAVFLFCRRTHSATASFFYPEGFQMILTFALVLTFGASRWAYWAAAIMLLMTREDAAVYVGAFAALEWFRRPVSRRRASATFILACVWFAVATLIGIPASRAADGLPAGSLLLSERFAPAGASLTPGLVAERLVSVTTAERGAALLATTGFLPIAGGAWLLPAVPGLLANMSAPPDSFAAAVRDHYAFPILPWLFMATAAGALWLHRRWPRFAQVWLLILLAATLADNPAMRRIHTTALDPEATRVRAQLRGLSANVWLAQSNLIPHLPHLSRLYSIGADLQPPEPADLVVMTTVGALWPLDASGIQALIRQYRADPRYQEIISGPLYAFEKR